MSTITDLPMLAGHDAGDLIDRLTADELRKLYARHRAREMFDAEQRPVAEPFDAGTLEEVLARPKPPAARVEGLVPWEASTLITAQRKTGKTTAVLNLARALISGESFLGRFNVRPVAGEIAILNFEVSADTQARWADEVGIDRRRLFLVNLRGRRNPFTDRTDRGHLADLLRSRGTETLIVDPFGRAYDGQSQNDAGEVGAWLVELERFARTEVGALDLILTNHAGWNADRSRGSSALEDWPDSIITLTRDDRDDSDGARYLRAVGRDVDVDECQLAFDPATRLLTLTGHGSRRQATQDRRTEDLIAAVVEVVTANPGRTGRQVEVALREMGVAFQKGDERKALNSAVDRGLVRREHGSNNARFHFPGEAAPSLPEHPHEQPGMVEPPTEIEPPQASPSLPTGIPASLPAALYRGGDAGDPRDEPNHTGETGADTTPYEHPSTPADPMDDTGDTEPHGDDGEPHGRPPADQDLMDGVGWPDPVEDREIGSSHGRSPVCSSCGGPNTEARDAAGLVCLSCYGRSLARKGARS